MYTYKRLIYFQKHDFRTFWRITDDIWYITGKKTGSTAIKITAFDLKVNHAEPSLMH